MNDLPHTRKDTCTHTQPCYTSNIWGRQSKEASVIMLALIPVAGGWLYSNSCQHFVTGTWVCLHYQHFCRQRNTGKRTGRGGKKNFLVYARRWDKTTSAVLNGPWIVTGPPFPPAVIEGVSVTLLIVYSGCSVLARQSSKQSADCCFGRTVKVCPPLSDG